MILSFFPDDLRVATLEIKLLEIGGPGVSENGVSRSIASLANSQATKRAFGFRALVRDDRFGRRHHGMWIAFRLTPVHHFTYTSLRMCAARLSLLP